MKIPKTLISYLKLLLIIVVWISGLYVFACIDEWLPLAYMFTVWPTMLVLYGVLSYIYTKQIIFPNLFLCFICFVLIALNNIFKHGVVLPLDEWIFASVAITALPLTVSLITKLIIKIHSKYKQK